jgi:hypothetical protein
MTKSMGDKFKEILAELEEAEKKRKDIVVPVNSLKVNTDFTFESQDLGRVKMTDHAFGQLCQNVYRYALPSDYFRKLYKDDPQQFAETMNYHLQKGKETTRKFRLSGNEVRGIVSESYVPYDNLDALTLFMDTARELPNYELETSYLNDKVMFLRFKFPTTERTLGKTIDGKDDKNFVAMDLVNSEVGYASMVVNPSIYRLVCTNGMVQKKAEYGLFKQRHINFDPQEINERMNHSILNGVKMGEHMLDRFASAREIKIENPYEEIAFEGKRNRLSDKMLKEVRNNFDIEGEKSLYGVVNAFTRTARELPVERRIDMEKIASKVLDNGLKVKVS